MKERIELRYAIFCRRRETDTYIQYSPTFFKRKENMVKEINKLATKFPYHDWMYTEVKMEFSALISRHS